MPSPTALVTIDWTNDGDFADTGEDVSARLIAPLKAERGRNQIISLSPPVASDLTGEIDNRSGDYSPDNPLSPLSPNVDVGRRIRYALVNGPTPYDVMRGYLALVAPHPDVGRRTVEIGALGNMARLVDKKGFSSALYGDGTAAGAITADQAMHVVFDLAQIPSGDRAFDTCYTKLLWFCVRPDDELFDLAIRIWASEGFGARFYDGKDGKTYLKNRFAGLLEARSSSAQATFADASPEPYYLDWEPDSGEQSVVNVCSVPWQRRAADATDAVIWSFGDALSLAGGEARQLPVEPEGDDPITSVVVPVAGTDYTVAAGAIVGATFDRTSGPFVTLTLTAGASGATISGLQVRGRLARVVSSMRIANTVDASASLARYGPKPYQLQILPEIDPLVAQDFANAVVGQLQAPRPLRTIRVPLATSTMINAALAREVGDRIRIINAQSSFDRSMMIEDVRVEWPADDGPCCYLGCEAVNDVNYGFWDLGLWDIALWAY